MKSALEGLGPEDMDESPYHFRILAVTLSIPLCFLFITLACFWFFPCLVVLFCVSCIVLPGVIVTLSSTFNIRPFTTVCLFISVPGGLSPSEKDEYLQWEIGQQWASTALDSFATPRDEYPQGRNIPMQRNTAGWNQAAHRAATSYLNKPFHTIYTKSQRAYWDQQTTLEHQACQEPLPLRVSSHALRQQIVLK